MTNDQLTLDIKIRYFLKGHLVLRVACSKRISRRVEFEAVCPVPLTPRCPGQEEGDTTRLSKGECVSTEAATASLCQTRTQPKSLLSHESVHRAPSGAPRSLPHGHTPGQVWTRGLSPPEPSPTGLTHSARTQQGALSSGCRALTCCSLPFRRKRGRAPRASEKPQRAISSGLCRSARYCRISSSERKQREGQCLPSRTARTLYDISEMRE